MAEEVCMIVDAATKPLVSATQGDTTFTNSTVSMGAKLIEVCGYFTPAYDFVVTKIGGEAVSQLIETAELKKENANAFFEGPKDLGYGHYRVDHSKYEFVRNGVHIRRIEGFWGLAKVRLAKFKGLPKHSFPLHLKETEWRYNNRHSNKYKLLLTYLGQNPVS